MPRARAAALARRLRSSAASRDHPPSLHRETAATAAALAPFQSLASRLAAAASAWLPRRDASTPELAFGWWLWSEAEAGGAPRLFRVRDGAPAGAAPHLLLDLARLADAEGAAALGEVRLSPRGEYVAVTLDGGRDAWRGVVLRAADGRVVARLPGAASIEFGGDGALLYVAQDAAGRPAVAMRRVGWDGTGGYHDTLIFAEPDPSRILTLAATKNRRLVTLTSAGPAEAAVRVLEEGRAGPPTLVAPPEAGGELFVEHWRDSMVALTNSRAGAGGALPAGCAAGDWWLARALLGAPPASWAPLLPRRPHTVITDVDVFDGAIVVHERDAASGRAGVGLLRRRGAGALPTYSRLRLPDGAWCIRSGSNIDPGAPTARLLLSSPIAPDAPADVRLADGTLAPALREPAPASAARAAATAAAAAAGVTVWREAVGNGVPVTVVGRWGEASHPPLSPTLLVLYGAYGVPLDAEFRPLHLALAARGWRIALVHTRGGGERGRGWHAAGRGASRRRVAQDAEAAVAWAAARSPTVPGGSGAAAVAVEAESAGALVAADLITRFPASLAAVTLSVPFLMPAGDDPNDPLAAVEVGEWAAPGETPACPLAALRSPAAAAAAPTGPPVLIQAAADDARAPAEGAAAWARALRAARGRRGARVLLTVRAGGHAPPGGEEGTQHAAQAAAFLVAAVERGAFRPQAGD